MSSSETLYTFRVSTPNYLERARTQVVKLPAYRDGALVAPTEAGSTFSLYDESNTAIVDAQAVTVTNSIAEYTIDASVLTDDLGLSDRWREEWSLVMPDGTTRLVRRDAGLALHLLYPVVTLEDLVAKHRTLTDILPKTDPYAQGYLDDAWITINNRIVSKGRRPHLIMQPWALKEVHETLTLSRIFKDASTSLQEGGGQYKRDADSYKQDFENAWAALSFAYDSDQDGEDDGTDNVAAEPVVSLNAPPRWW
jgi:hypothetical protein